MGVNITNQQKSYLQGPFCSFRTMKKKTCRKSVSIPIIPDEGLGDYVNGYDNYNVSLPWGRLIFMIFLSILAAFFIFLSIALLIVSFKDGVWLFLLLLGSSLVAVVTNMFVKQVLRRTRVFVYENGFIWEMFKRNGETIRLDKINFDDVDGIDFPITRRYLNGFYTGTSYKLTVWSKGRILLSISGLYKNKNDNTINDWGYLALNAIMERWNKVGLGRINSELSKNGFVCFTDKSSNKIEVGRTYIKVGSEIINKDHIKYKFSAGLLYIHNDMKKEHWLKKYETIINVNTMTNSHLFLCAVGSLLDIK